MDELIKRNDLLKEICGWCTNYVADTPICEEKECAYTLCVKSAPTVDAEPVVHGHWVTNIYDRDFVRIDKDGFPEKSCYCSVCGDWLTASDEYAVRGYYCPNCGAKMDETE